MDRRSRRVAPEPPSSSDPPAAPVGRAQVVPVNEPPPRYMIVVDPFQDPEGPYGLAIQRGDPLLQHMVVPVAPPLGARANAPLVVDINDIPQIRMPMVQNTGAGATRAARPVQLPTGQGVGPLRPGMMFAVPDRPGGAGGLARERPRRRRRSGPSNAPPSDEEEDEFPRIV